MAGKTYYAATKIKFGRRKEDGSELGKYEQITFEPGDKVTGLELDDMKSLWTAGALTTEAPAKDEEDDEDTSESTSDDEAKAKAEAAAKAKADAAAKAKATAGSRGTSQS